MENNLNICIVTQQYKNIFSGPGTYSNILLTHLKKNKFKVTLLVPESQAVSEPGVNVITVKDPFVNSHARWIPLSIYFNLALKKIEEKNKFDLIHFTDIRDGYFVFTTYNKIGNINDTYLTEYHSIKQLKKIYSDWQNRWLYYTLARFIEKRYILSFKTIIANSQYTFDITQKYYPKVKKKLQLCYKSINNDLYPPKQFSKFNDDKIKVLFVGGNMERKGIITLIKSAIYLINKCSIEFYIIGNDPKIRFYKSICKYLNVEQNFIFLGNVSPQKLSYYYQQSDIFVLPSHEEALGISILEAMACNTPVIGANVGGIPEIIIDNQNGLLIEPGNEKMLALKIFEIVTNKDLQINLTKNALNTLEKFSTEKMLKKTLEIYKTSLLKSD
jgi:glycosyltransferase involved in cell wall biosynthesis